MYIPGGYMYMPGGYMYIPGGYIPSTKIYNEA